MDSSARRLEKLRRLFRMDRVDVLLVASEPNVRYLTGFTGEASVLLVAKDRTLLVSDGRFATQLEQECPALEVSIRPVGQPLFEGLGEVVDKFGAHRVGFEPASLTVANFETLKDKAKTVEWVGVVGKVEALRSVKDRAEVEAIRQAVDQAERAFAHAPGQSDRGRLGEGTCRLPGGLPPQVRGICGRFRTHRGGRSSGGIASRPADERSEDR